MKRFLDGNFECTNTVQGNMEPERRQELVAQGKSLKDRLAKLEEEVVSLEVLLQQEGQKLPNLTHPKVSCCLARFMA